MSARVLWLLSVPLALLTWCGILILTGAAPPSPFVNAVFLPLLTLATTMTLAPVVWVGARILHLPGTGDQPGLALRAAFWMGLWLAICAGLKLNDLFSWVPALALAAVLVLFETFLLQMRRTPAGRRR